MRLRVNAHVDLVGLDTGDPSSVTTASPNFCLVLSVPSKMDLSLGKVSSYRTDVSQRERVVHILPCHVINLRD